MPPGTGDTQLSISQSVELSGERLAAEKEQSVRAFMSYSAAAHAPVLSIQGAVIVSTPQDVALSDARRYGSRCFANAPHRRYTPFAQPPCLCVFPVALPCSKRWTSRCSDSCRTWPSSSAPTARCVQARRGCDVSHPAAATFCTPLAHVILICSAAARHVHLRRGRRGAHGRGAQCPAAG